MNANQTCIIIGASHAGAQLATSLRREGWAGRIVVIGEESVLPYHRPPLSKALLNGEKTADQLEIFKPSVYEKADIEFMLGTVVTAIDRSDKRVLLTNGESLHYDKLALCTGARVRCLSIPGADLGGVHYLRDLRDASSIQAEVREGARAVIVGGGYIGLETAASLSKLGMKVTVLEMMDRVLERVTAPPLSEYYTKLHSRHGVKILTNTQAQSLRGNGTVASVECNEGLSLPADLVIIGIGVIPNTGLAESSGLEVDNGIIVNEFACTSDPDIVAAGDCTFHPNNVLGYHLRLESVPNAMEQAKTAAASLCGKQKPYHSLPWFWSDQYNIKLQIAGFNKGYDRVEIMGNPDQDQFVAWYIQGDRLLAADCINSPKEFIQAKKLIASGASIAELNQV
ncbi:MAG TPA: pyridine nucleotide-disulfide oxidoreductase [Gammaproteobacteria bacterium]|nr:pyridine nucleotide-disulfide oxidoreductase [Pseudomonadales bacterium]HAG93361.1 pyridine nucleotide-disulfide oxidoreductase [Gammaproteobacteria bacterium]HAU16135.1 pyridine nucleotide-disulfide oxidoreductase [Gammaproteobacteria bacterium]|tara:strand:- start:66 stop:1256 length:1191 start_codon:yes stop_codon:yes gene_type:complete